MKWLLVFFIFTTHVFSLEPLLQCHPEQVFIISSELQNIAEVLQFYGANDEQMEQANCKTQELPSLQEMEKFINDFDIGDDTSEVIHNVRFEKETPAKLDAFKRLTTRKYDHFNERDEVEPQVDIQGMYQINPKCQKVNCALEKIWGNEMAIKLMYMQMKFGYNGSELAYEQASRFTSRELDNVLLALEDLPPHLIPMQKEKKLVHFTRGERLAVHSESVIACAAIHVYDNFGKDTDMGMQNTIYHEVAHNIGSRLNRLDDSAKWREVAGWNKKGENWDNTDAECKTSKYANTNPLEDFSESIVAYRYNSDDFLRRCPGKYNFLKKSVFHDIEYLAEAPCVDIGKEKLAKMSHELINEILPNLDLKISSKTLIANCENQFSTYPVGEDELHDCFKKIIKSQLKKSSNFEEFLKKNHIPQNEFYRQFIYELIMSQNQSHEFLKTQALVKQPQMQKGLEEVVKNHLSSYFPKDFLGQYQNPNGDGWQNLIGNRCGHEIFNLTKLEMSKELSDCIAREAMVHHERLRWTDEIRIFPDLPPLALFSEEGNDIIEKEYYLLIENWVSGHPKTKLASKTFINQYKEQLKQRFSSREYDVRKIELKRGWQNMSSENFCKIYATKLYIPNVRISPSQENKIVKNWCLKVQAGSPKRVKLKARDFNSYLDANLM